MRPLILATAAACMLGSGMSLAQTAHRTGSTPAAPAVTAPAAPTATAGAPAGAAGSDRAAARDDGDTAAAAGNDNQAVATTSANAPAPAKGANSFTSGQAKSRIEKNGFSNVSDLTKDDNGVWRGTAQKDGSTVNVWLDYKGNVGESR